MLKARFTLFQFLPLFILLIPTLNAGSSTSRDPQSSNSVPTHGHSMDGIGKEEIDKLDGDISAVYIVRAIYKRAEVVKTLMNELPEMFKKRLEEELQELENNCNIDNPADAQKLEDEKKEAEEIHNIWLTQLDDSILSENKIDELKTELVWLLRTSKQIWDEKMELSELEQTHPWKRKNKISDQRVEEMTRELNEKETKMKKVKSVYATKVFDLLKKYERKVAVLKHHDWQKPTGIIAEEELEQLRNPYDKLAVKCYQLCVEIRNFLKQIQLELQLYHDYRKEHMFSDKEIEKLNKELKLVIYDKNKPLLKSGDTFASFLDVAEMANREGNSKWREYLQKLADIWHNVAYFIIPKMTPEEREEIYGHIVKEQEMPAAWYLGVKKIIEARGQAAPPEMVRVRLRLLMVLAETLLIYERLNAFYMIDDHQKMWQKNKCNDEETSASQHQHLCALLSPYFAKFEIGNGIKQEKISAVGGNISAVYIVDAIGKRTVTVKQLATEAMQMVTHLKEEAEEAVKQLKGKGIEILPHSNSPDIPTGNVNKEKLFFGDMAKAKPRAGVVQFKDEVDELERVKNMQKEAEYWIRVVEDLKLSDIEIKKIIDELAKVLKGKKNQEEYLAHVEAQINKFTQKVAKHQAHKEILTIHQQLHEEAHEEQPWEFPHTHMFEIVPEMIVKHVNLLEQIKLEIRLHYEFIVLTEVELHYDSNADDWPGTDHLNSKDLEAFEGIVKDLDKLNEKNIKEHEEAVNEAHLNNPKLKRKKFPISYKKKQRRQQEALERDIKAALNRFKKNSHRIRVLTDLNNAGISLYVQLAGFIKSPFHDGHKIVTSILELAEQVVAVEEEDFAKENAHASLKIHMENDIKIWSIVAHSILPKLPANWHFGEIFSVHQIEMPREWFSKIKSEVEFQQPVHHEGQGVHIHNAQVTEEMVEKRIKLQLAKTLLVYNRLNAFYMLEHFHQICVEKKYPVDDSAYKLLDSTFAKFDVDALP